MEYYKNYIMVIIKSYEDFATHTNKELGVSSWHKITQEQIDSFASATLDYQWIHVNPERACKESPFKTTIAHGYLMLSLIPYFWKQIVDVQNLSMEVNYGLEQLKFGQAVVVDSEVRCRVTLKSIINLKGVTKATLFVQLEIKDQKKTAFAGNVMFLYHFIKPSCSRLTAVNSSFTIDTQQRESKTVLAFSTTNV